MVMPSGGEKRGSTPVMTTTTTTTPTPTNPTDSSSDVENPKIIKLSNTEYYFPTTSTEAESGPNHPSDGNVDVNEKSPAQKESRTRQETGIPKSKLASFHSFTPLNTEDYVDDEELTLSMPDLTANLTGDERLTSFKDTMAKPVTVRPGGLVADSDDDDWEEMLLYVDLDDIPNVDELFAVEPDDFLTFQSKRQREVPKAKKPTLSELHMKLHNLDSSSPILQIGTRYYVGKYEEPMGSSLMFQARESDDSQPSTSRTRPSQRLSSIIPEPRPARDKVYHEKLCSSKYPEYELVANVSKVLKMTRKEVRLAGGDLLLLPPTPSGLPAPVPGDASWPVGYTTTEILSGKYQASKIQVGLPTPTNLDADDSNSIQQNHDGRDHNPRTSVSISEDSITDDTEPEGMALDVPIPESIVGRTIPSGSSILGLE